MKPAIWSKRELRRICSEFRNGLLGSDSSSGKCAMVCLPLASYLGMFGLSVKIVEVDFGRINHFWLELENGEILDPTADQFSGKWLKLPKVYIGPVPEIYKKWMKEAEL